MRSSSSATRAGRCRILCTLAASFVVAFLATGSAFAGTRERLSLDAGWLFHLGDV
ncbi:MAG: hypothetical protein JF571_14945, partial [Asticcacaulis sp.]|nr:hypothetical protein [Asticcacaulis sp.]